MEDSEKLEMLKSVLGIEDTEQDFALSTYLKIAAREIINWRYSYLESWEETYTVVPTEYEVTQVMAVVAGYSIRGAEGQATHSENGISRTFKYEDMVAYIRDHVIPYAGTF